ncbi:hypothetical protein LCGC14_1867080 [marine sediment metagenome]|uniref:Uncharacterized protein n=1 Tax=marine sediment metagenome TaxID=412755 RepID=A0A0F9G5Z3_9ZZZZ
MSAVISMTTNDAEERLLQAAWENLDDAIQHLWDLQALRRKRVNVDDAFAELRQDLEDVYSLDGDAVEGSLAERFATLSTVQDVLEVLANNIEEPESSFRRIVIKSLDRLEGKAETPVPASELS